jgi:hypothetical protein
VRDEPAVLFVIRFQEPSAVGTMTRSISIVEYKVEQARFFLEQIPHSNHNFFAVQCFTDAFALACRSITFAMQAVISEVEGFKEWYAARVEGLKKDKLALFFNAYRTASIHIGDTVVRGGSAFIDSMGKRRVQYFFLAIPGVPDVPSQDVVSACTMHFISVLTVVYDAFMAFPCHLDDQWHYTEPHFRRMGKSIEDAAEELGFHSGWMSTTPEIPEAEKWRTLRRTQAVGCQLNDAFQRYLGRILMGPDDMP